MGTKLVAERYRGWADRPLVAGVPVAVGEAAGVGARPLLHTLPGRRLTLRDGAGAHRHPPGLRRLPKRSGLAWRCPPILRAKRQSVGDMSDARVSSAGEETSGAINAAARPADASVSAAPTLTLMPMCYGGHVRCSGPWRRGTFRETGGAVGLDTEPAADDDGPRWRDSARTWPLAAHRLLTGGALEPFGQRPQMVDQLERLVHLEVDAEHRDAHSHPRSSSPVRYSQVCASSGWIVPQ